MLRFPTLSAALLVCASAIAGAQNVRVSAGRANWSANGTTVTSAFVVANRRSTPVQTRQRIEVPATWRVVTGAGRLTVQPSESGLLIVSAMVPVKTAAGGYVMRVTLYDAVTDSLLGTDSVSVVVLPHRALDVTMIDHPSFIISGKSYDATFVVRNRSNVDAPVQLKARSSLGTAVLPQREMRLAPDESRTIRVRVTQATTVGSAADDVIELVASQSDSTTVMKRASARVTVVPAASTAIDDYQRVPAELSLRAANTGVSPYVLSGSGRVRDGGSERVSFRFKGRPGPTSAFGDRDEYRLDVRSRSWNVRAGDQLFAASPLTGGSQEGMGLGAEKSFGNLGVGGYAQRSRRAPGTGGEAGGFISARPAEGVRLALNAVDRLNGPLTGKVGSLSANVQREWYSLDAEVARSADSIGSGIARVVHGSGERNGVTFDFGHARTDSAFLGPQRGSEHDYLSASATPSELLTLTANASAHAAQVLQASNRPGDDHLRLASAGVTVANLVTLEAAGAIHQRRDVRASDERQTSLRARATPEIGAFGATLTAEMGRAVRDTGADRVFSDVSLNVGLNGSRGTMSVFGERYSGGSVVRGLESTVSIGSSAALHLSKVFEANVIATANRLGGLTPFWSSNVDAQLSRLLNNGATMTLRARVMHGGSGVTPAPVAYLEYSMPLGLPVSRLRTPGRANGRVIDAETGRGVANALVRLGPQVGITDKNGRVTFGGLPAGEHRVSLSQETSYADAVFLGDPVLHVDSSRGAPASFTLRIARGANVELSARRFAVSRTGIAGARDSLVDVGPLAGASFRLVGERDTVYRTTDDNGHLSFADVVPGKWIVEADGDVPSFHRFTPERMEVDLTPGQTQNVVFHLIPRPREVKIMNASQDVPLVSAEPPAVPNSSSPRTARPQVLQPQLQQKRNR